MQSLATIELERGAVPDGSLRHGFGSPLFRLTAVGGFIALSVWSIAKGILPLFHIDELYFWVNTYAHGPVRRGLVGTIVAPFIGGVDVGRVHQVAALVCLAGLAGVVVTVGVLLWRDMSRPGRSLIGVPAVLLAVSPFLGLIAHHVGYPDSLIAALLLLCGLGLPYCSAPLIAVALVMSSAVHEMAFLLLLPLAMFNVVMRQGWRLQDYAIIGVGVVAAVCVPLVGAPGSPDLTARLVAAGLTSADAGLQIGVSLQQGVGQVLGTMAGIWRSHPLNGVLGIVYAGLPGFCITLIGLPSVIRAARTRTSSVWYRTAYVGTFGVSCLGGLALLAIAWDLARIASFTTLTSFIAVWLIPRRDRVRPDLRVAGLSVVLATCYMCLPVFNLYFDYGRPVRMGMITRICQPCAQAGLSMINAFNRNLSPQERQKIDTDPLYGD